MSSLTTWLAGLDEPGLTTVLANRPEALRAPRPRSLSELAERLQHVDSVFAAAFELTRPALQSVEALLALGEERTVDALAALLAGDGAGHRAHVEQVLAELRGRALVWPDHGRLRPAAALHQAFPAPLGFGSPARVLLRERTATDLQKISAALGLGRSPGKKQDVLDAVCVRLADADFVRAHVAALPADARELLDRRARGRDPGEFAGSFDPSAYRRHRAAEDAAIASGLLLRENWGYQTTLPAEIARALRGPEYRAPFTPVRPQPPTRPADAAAVTSEAAARTAAFAEQATAVLDAIAAKPAACVKSGGVGAREITRLGKAVQAGEDVVRLALELAEPAGLIDASRGQVLTTAGYDAWREQEPGARLAPLLRAWWELAATPTTSRDEDGKALPALARWQICPLCRNGRHALLAVAASLPDGQGTTPDGALASAAWTRPALHLNAGSDGVPLAWQEAETLGVIAHGTLSATGRALHDEDGDALAGALDALLPPAAQQATFGSDLTVLVAGSPSAAVNALLTACADRESRGSASMWRITPASVRRALDDGHTAASLDADLAAIATGDLPQPLRYLIADVGRRHGHLRVSTATSVVCGEDEALLAEVAAHRGLRRLQLRLLAPTVLASAAGVADTLAALRGAGYLPVPAGPDGEVRLERSRPARAGKARTGKASPPVRAAAAAVDPAALARALLGGTSAAAGDQASLTEVRVGEYADGLSAAEIRQLAYAIDEGAPIRLGYQASTGGFTTRVVSELVLDPPYLAGWCHLRDAERVFTLSRIRSAAAV